MKEITKNRNLYAGTVLVAAGVVWLLYNYNVVGPRFFDVCFSWQMLLVVIGGFLISARNVVAGWIVGGVGLLFLLAMVFDFDVSFSKIVLPALLIVAGLGLLLTRRK